MFIDKAQIIVKAGDGGNGCVAFHREKYVANGGPDGGDGGRGGDVYVVVDDHMSTLMDFKYIRKYKAGTGIDGQGKRCSGKDGESLTIKVPRGTLIRDTETGGIIADISQDEPFLLAKGGRGGWGNKHFATPTRQTPRFAKPGLPGEEREVTLELKLLADVGLVGFPNVGKSTLLSAVTKANPKIANYHFTTLFPNLGVIQRPDGESFVMADIPGIIQGASDGAGLGHEFLRHIDRCRLIIHVVDISGCEGRDPIEDFKAINQELLQYSPELASRKQIIAANKSDIIGEDRELADKFMEFAKNEGYPVFEISAAAHQGTRELINETARLLGELPPVVVYEPNYVPPAPEIGRPEELHIEVIDDVWVVEGDWLKHIASTVNFSDTEARMYFNKVLEDSGIFQRLEDMGIEDGDTVSMYNLEFEFWY